MPQVWRTVASRWATAQDLPPGATVREADYMPRSSSLFPPRAFIEVLGIRGA
jgi:hypothetical protein